ncbi:hypothetical protein [Kaistia nematophila]|uniref:Uncharacterized protein n=1 Tax=Kaistia nematophila TaxID=2994654 RepID=A0A9X3E1F0_9HYPH|nr:hypothetical protein [Kaistia nematophila]MCX5569639.1 hypothetical protein [Kaistia nematophila]
MARFSEPSIHDVTEITASVFRHKPGALQAGVTLMLQFASGPDDSVMVPVYMPADCAEYADRIAAGIKAAFTDPVDEPMLEAAE